MIEKKISELLNEILPNNEVASAIVSSAKEIIGDCFFDSAIFVSSKGGVHLICDEDDCIGFVDSCDLPEMEVRRFIFLGTPYIKGEMFTRRLNDWLKENDIALLKWRQTGDESADLIDALNRLRKETC